MERNIKTIAKRFKEDEDGNATIDWVVLTAGLVTLCITVAIMISTSTNTAASEINSAMQNMEPASAGG